MSEKKPLRVLHCPCDVGGQAGTLAKFERNHGLRSWSVALTQAALGMPIDEVVSGTGKNRFRLELGRLMLIFRAAFCYDVIHFNYGRSIAPLDHRVVDRYQNAGRLKRWLSKKYAEATWFWDLALLKFLGKTIVMTYQGDDARQGDVCRKVYRYSPAQAVDSEYYTQQSDESKRNAINEVERFADQIYVLNPDLLRLMPKGARFLPYANIDFREWCVVPRNHSNEPLVIHAPTSREFKGTEFILAAVDELKREGVKFRFQLIENMTRKEARLLYEHADLLIDQVLAGWYGGLAVELMALGKPVICYLREEDFSVLPNEMRDDIPIINANPETLKDVLQAALTLPVTSLVEIGSRSRKYVEKWHDPSKIALALKKDYEMLFYKTNI